MGFAANTLIKYKSTGSVNIRVIDRLYNALSVRLAEPSI